MRLERWLATFSCANTIRQYKSGVGRFLKTVYGEGDIFELADRYVEERAKDLSLVAGDVDDYFIMLKDRPPKTQSGYLSAVRTFLIDQRVELGDAFWRKFNRRRKGKLRALTKDHIPNSEELRRLLAHMTVRGRAVFLVMASAGTRIKETVCVRLEDINLGVRPVPMTLRAETTKTGVARTVFISDEAVEALEEWLKIRSRWLLSNAARIRDYRVTPDDERVFPWRVENCYAMWNLALRKTGMESRDESTKRRTLHPHCLRKRFRTLLGVYSVDLTEALMGHESYLSDAYRRPDMEMLRDFYAKMQHVLTLNIERATVIELKEQTQKKEREVDDLRREMAELKAQMARLIMKGEEA